MEKTLQIQLSELREQIAKEIESWVCTCADDECGEKYVNAHAAAIARGQK